jgi:hypothetical protein
LEVELGLRPGLEVDERLVLHPVGVVVAIEVASVAVYVRPDRGP